MSLILTNFNDESTTSCNKYHCQCFHLETIFYTIPSLGDPEELSSFLLTLTINLSMMTLITSWMRDVLSNINNIQMREDELVYQLV